MLILASNSPRRRQLLRAGGWSFSVQPADIDETPRSREKPGAYVLRLAEKKARVVAAQLLSAGTVVAADTTVADGDQILGKPADRAEALSMLRLLRGRQHQVFTAVAAWKNGNLVSDLCQTQVWMRAYSDEEIRAYVNSGDPLDKAGAYAIQHTGFHPVDYLIGCYSNVVGLPVCRLARLLEGLGEGLAPEVLRSCSEHSRQPCLIYQRLMSA